MKTEKQDRRKQVKLVSFRHITVTIIGFLIMLLTGIFGLSAGQKHFFQLIYSTGKGGHYMSAATFFLIGLIIFIWGLYDILKIVYFVYTQKHKKKELYNIDSKDKL